jgi:hypothetical protein
MDIMNEDDCKDNAVTCCETEGSYSRKKKEAHIITDLFFINI